MKTENLTIASDSKNGKLLIGSDFHVLKDESSASFNTSDMESFIAFLKNEKEYKLFYSERNAVAAPVSINRYDDDIATLSLNESKALQYLIKGMDKNMSLERFEEFLAFMKIYLDDTGLNLLSLSRDFRASKVTKVQRKKERNGNYHFMISKESAGNDDFEPPEKVSFKVPIFEHINQERTFSFDFEFDYKIDEGEVDVFFKIFNPQFSTELKKVQKEIMIEELKPLEVSKYWGNLKVNQHTDSWKYEKNEASI